MGLFLYLPLFLSFANSWMGWRGLLRDLLGTWELLFLACKWLVNEGVEVQ